MKLPIGYWRKANAIHRWFIHTCAKGVDDCREMSVSYDQLMELKRLCQQVLDDHNKAPELLPTQEGFFFGSTDYGECYFDDLKDTIKILDKVEDGYWYIYQASW